MPTESNEILGKERSTSIPEVKSTTDPSIAITAPGQIKVIKRNGTVVSFEESKITVAITKAFLAVEGGNAAASSRVHKTVEKMKDQVIATFHRRMPSGGTIHIEDIQDQVELALMRAEEHKTARNSIRDFKEINKKKEALKSFPSIVSLIDKLSKKNIIHSNKAANLKSKLAAHIAKLK